MSVCLDLSVCFGATVCVEMLLSSEGCPLLLSGRLLQVRPCHAGLLSGSCDCKLVRPVRRLLAVQEKYIARGLGKRGAHARSGPAS